MNPMNVETSPADVVRRSTRGGRYGGKPLNKQISCQAAKQMSYPAAKHAYLLRELRIYTSAREEEISSPWSNMRELKEIKSLPESVQIK